VHFWKPAVLFSSDMNWEILCSTGARDWK